MNETKHQMRSRSHHRQCQLLPQSMFNPTTTAHDDLQPAHHPAYEELKPAHDDPQLAHNELQPAHRRASASYIEATNLATLTVKWRPVTTCNTAKTSRGDWHGWLPRYVRGGHINPPTGCQCSQVLRALESPELWVNPGPCPLLEEI